MTATKSRAQGQRGSDSTSRPAERGSHELVARQPKRRSSGNAPRRSSWSPPAVVLRTGEFERLSRLASKKGGLQVPSALAEYKLRVRGPDGTEYPVTSTSTALGAFVATGIEET